MERKCYKCKNIKVLETEFYKDKHHTSGFARLCKKCDNFRHRSRKRSLIQVRKDIASSRKSHLNSIGQDFNYDKTLLDQGFACKLCGSKDSKRKNAHFQIDHDHSCCPGKKICGICIRGLLCFHCNTGLGLFQDNIELLIKAVEYLKENKQRLKELGKL